MTERQQRVIRKVIAVTQAAGISAWLFGRWGLDARIAGQRASTATSSSGLSASTLTNRRQRS
jgi:hypothetical protein